MADRSFYLPEGSLEARVCEVYVNLVVGASGAVTSGTGKGVVSVVKESAAGQYTITLQDRYTSLLSASMALLHSTDSDPTTVGVHMRLNSEAVSAATPTVVLQCFAGDDGADANPASGARILVCLKMKNSTV